MRCTNDHERTDPDELLVHADVILFLGKHVAAQASRVEPCRNTLRPLPRDACQALRIQIRLAVSRVFAKLRDCKVSQHLGAVLKALLLEPRLKHAVLKEDQVCPAAWGDAEDHLVQNVVSRANNDGPCRSVGWERVSPLQNHVLATSHCGESLADSTCTNNNSGLNCTRSFIPSKAFWFRHFFRFGFLYSSRCSGGGGGGWRGLFFHNRFFLWWFV
mmetsp:Transcript_11910/g.33569  ORF Transcript_11910/g.33569 Transcript_11910/m.33569 type:complete len:216 (+) Transcript_11910:1007-1654(+)